MYEGVTGLKKTKRSNGGHIFQVTWQPILFHRNMNFKEILSVFLFNLSPLCGILKRFDKFVWSYGTLKGLRVKKMPEVVK